MLRWLKVKGESITKTLIENHKLYQNNGEIELLYYPNSHAYKVDGDKKIGVTTVIDVIEKEGLRYYYMNEALNFVRRYVDVDNDGKFSQPITNVEQWEEVVRLAKVAHRLKSDRGKENGTKTHEWLEQFLIAKRDGMEVPSLPEPLEIPKKVSGLNWDEILDIEVKIEFNNLIDALLQFIDYFEAHDIEIVALERIIYSKRYDYAGRFDAILRIDGKLYLVDFKTNNPTKDYPKGVFPDMFCQLGGYDVAYTEENYPELDAKNQSCFDGHVIFNFSKRTGKFNKQFTDDVRVDRAWFLHTLGTKRALQHHTRNLSMMYKENRKKG